MSSESNQPNTAAPPAPSGKPRWLRYSLRTLFVFVTLCALAAYQGGKWWRQMKDEEEAIAALNAIQDVALRVERAKPNDDEQNRERPPAWFCTLVGRRDFAPCYGAEIHRDFLPPDDPMNGAVRPRRLISDDLAWLAKLPGLTSVAIHCPNMDSEALQHLSPLRHLSAVRIELRTLNDAGVAVLASLPLEWLSVVVETSMVQDWTPLSQLKSLKYLDLDIYKNSASALQSLDKLPSLEELWLRGAGIGDSDLVAVRELANLRDLKLHCRLNGDGLVHLRDLPKLTTLALDCQTIDLPNLSHLRDLRKLNDLTLELIDLVEELPAALAGLDQLESLELSAALTMPAPSPLVLSQWTPLPPPLAVTRPRAPEIMRARVVALVQRLPALKSLRLHNDIGSQFFAQGVDVAAVRRGETPSGPAARGWPTAPAAPPPSAKKEVIAP